MGRLGGWLMAGLGAWALLATGIEFASTPVLATDYGSGAAYQVAVSTSSSLGGIWLWIELDRGGTGEYQGADCVHAPHTLFGVGTSADSGMVNWTSNGSTLTITGLSLADGVFGPQTVEVPASDGHYVLDFYTVFPDFPPLLPPPQVTVAP